MNLIWFGRGPSSRNPFEIPFLQLAVPHHDAHDNDIESGNDDDDSDDSDSD
ncbi:hypothetical protein KIN20_028138 [Parelaphostrongylus tenuis]|uniref:Uncharacterized protein n=1 Tax=Parelaphostrongylus tenuis TaxID=148309 RepID=A0AAD5WEG3_PARTN|nr:hypothetical protein KIN20_028138 [Parelaphostrongylus tenuis]